MEVFWFALDGSLYHAWWDNQWHVVPLYGAKSGAVNGTIAAVSRIATSMELFWNDAISAELHAYFYPDTNWQKILLEPGDRSSILKRLAEMEEGTKTKTFTPKP